MAEGSLERATLSTSPVVHMFSNPVAVSKMNAGPGLREGCESGDDAFLVGVSALGLV